jgi:hypothetical protein
MVCHLTGGWLDLHHCLLSLPSCVVSVSLIVAVPCGAFTVSVVALLLGNGLPPLSCKSQPYCSDTHKEAHLHDRGQTVATVWLIQVLVESLWRATPAGNNVRAKEQKNGFFVIFFDRMNEKKDNVTIC